MAFGTWNEISLVALLAVLIVVATKIGTIGSTIGGWLAKKPKGG